MNLNLFTIHFPIPAIVSILHRISGFILLLLIPVALWALNLSLTPDGFDLFRHWFGQKYVQILVWLFLIPLCFHLIAGIRHLLMDVNLGDTLKGGRLTAILTFLFTFVLIILAGIWLW